MVYNNRRVRAHPCSDTLEWYHSYWPATIIHLSMLCPIMHHHSSTRQMLGISYNIMETWLKRVPLVIKVFHLPLCIMRASNHTAKVKHLGSLVYHNTPINAMPHHAPPLIHKANIRVSWKSVEELLLFVNSSSSFRGYIPGIFAIVILWHCINDCISNALSHM